MFLKCCLKEVPKEKILKHVQRTHVIQQGSSQEILGVSEECTTVPLNEIPHKRGWDTLRNTSQDHSVRPLTGNAGHTQEDYSWGCKQTIPDRKLMTD